MNEYSMASVLNRHSYHQLFNLIVSGSISTFTRFDFSVGAGVTDKLRSFTKSSKTGLDSDILLGGVPH